MAKKVISSLGSRGSRSAGSKSAAKSTTKSKPTVKKAAKSAKSAPKPAAKSAVKKSAKPTAKKVAAKKVAAKKVTAKKLPAKKNVAKQPAPAKPIKAAPAKPTKEAVVPAVEEKQKGRRRAPLAPEEINKEPVPLAHQGVIEVPKVYKQPDSIPKDKQRESDDETLWNANELKAMRKRLEADLGQRKLALETAQQLLDELISFTDDGAGGETADTGNTILEREEQISRVTDAEAKLEQTVSAIVRIDEKRYGFCEECGKPIGKLRLQEGNPYATLCIKCKELADRAY